MEDKEDHSKRPEDTNFKQQRLKAWQPLLTPAYVIATFFVIGIVFIPIGAVIYSASSNVVEITTRYDNEAACALQSTCTLTVPIEKDMKGPVYFYYRLTNFYQNHRRYVKSRSDEQLAGTSVSSTSACDPLTSDANSVGLFPCGLIANSVFNDTFSFQLTSGGTTSTPQALQTEISWKSDRDKKFKDPGNMMVGNPAVPVPWTVSGADGLTRNLSVASNGQPRAIGVSPTGIVDGDQYKGIADEHFIVWMRTAGLPTFKKLWARFPDGFTAGDSVSVTINNQFPTSQFNGEKAIVFSTTSWLGGKNDFLGIAYLTVGCLCIALGAVFWIKHCVSPRPLGDMQYLNWPGSTSAAQRS